jgi:caspase domain-containing protein
MWLKAGVASALAMFSASMTAAQAPSAPETEPFTRDLDFRTLDLIFRVEDMGEQTKATPFAAKPPAAPPAKSPDTPPVAAGAPKSPTDVPPVAAVTPKSAINDLPAPSASPAPVTPLGRRVALVIGNANYKTASKLLNPRNDAGDVAAALRSAGFSEVIERYDLGMQDLQKALRALEDKATGADWAVVYYAGHGIEVDGRNYLIPVDAELKSASDVEDEAVSLDRVMARVTAASKLQLVILDACRDNPFVRRMAQGRGTARAIGARGLAPVEPSYPNQFVAYAARHGEVALDGSGKNSPYAKALVKHLAMPGLALSNFFIRVRAEVLAETSGKQRPFEYGSLTDENLSFRPAGR